MFRKYLLLISVHSTRGIRRAVVVAVVDCELVAVVDCELVAEDVIEVVAVDVAVVDTVVE